MDTEDPNDYKYDFGLEHNWSKPNIPIPFSIHYATTWLQNEIEQTNDEPTSIPLQMFLDHNNQVQEKPYSIHDLIGNQINIALEVLNTCKQWSNINNKHFKPLRLTIHG